MCLYLARQVMAACNASSLAPYNILSVPNPSGPWLISSSGGHCGGAGSCHDAAQCTAHTSISNCNHIASPQAGLASTNSSRGRPQRGAAERCDESPVRCSAQGPAQQSAGLTLYLSQPTVGKACRALEYKHIHKSPAREQPRTACPHHFRAHTMTRHRVQPSNHTAWKRLRYSVSWRTQPIKTEL
jgi:hypothetical protein